MDAAFATRFEKRCESPNLINMVIFQGYNRYTG